MLNCRVAQLTTKENKEAISMKLNTQCTVVIRKNQKRKEIKLGSEFDFVNQNAPIWQKVSHLGKLKLAKQNDSLNKNP